MKRCFPLLALALFSCSVTAPTVGVTGITLNTQSVTLVTGRACTLTAIAAPADATDTAVTWTSSDAAVASVASGVVTALAAGTATVTAATEDGGFIASCVVTVTGAVASGVTGVSLGRSTVTVVVGDAYALSATGAPAHAADGTGAWASTDAEVATVADGVVTARGTGTATIIATTRDGGFTATCTVTVQPLIETPDA